MVLKRTASAGTLGSSDILIQMEPGGNGIEISFTGSDETRKSHTTRSVIYQTLRELGVLNAKVIATDKGALDNVVRARVKAAASRSSREEQRIGEIFA